MLVFLSSLLLVLTGVVIGLRVVQLRAPQDPADESWGKSLPARVVVVTNTVVVRDEPARPATVDASLLQPLEASGITVVPESDGTVRLIFNAPVFSSRVVLDPDQTACLDQLGTLLATHSSEWEAKVVGHTDDVPFRGSGMVRDNRELGLARAVEVVRYLSRQTGIPASMLSAATAGEENPPFPGNDPESRLKNRTVTLVIRPLSK
jgi:chemotaxis protein MotB